MPLYYKNYEMRIEKQKVIDFVVNNKNILTKITRLYIMKKSWDVVRKINLTKID